MIFPNSGQTPFFLSDRRKDINQSKLLLFYRAQTLELECEEGYYGSMDFVETDGRSTDLTIDVL